MGKRGGKEGVKREKYEKGATKEKGWKQFWKETGK